MTKRHRSSCGVAPVTVALLAWFAVAQAASEDDLASARDALQAALSSLSRAQDQYHSLEQSNSLDETARQDFLAYLDRLEQLAAERCSRIDAIRSQLNQPGVEPGCTALAPLAPEVVSYPDEMTEDERIASLENQLQSSLSDFDELLLREMDELEQQRTSADPSGGGGGGQQAGAEGSSGETAGGEAEGQDEQPGESEQQTGEEQTASRSGSSDPTAGGGIGGGSDEPTETAPKRDDVPSAEDDDIVARQLREAAENETDPELREKLWEEYRRYKAESASASN